MFFFKEEKNLVRKEKKYFLIFQYFMKILGKFQKFLTNTLAKMPQNIFAYFSASEYSESFSLF